MSQIYLDHNATSPLRPEVQEDLFSFLSNPTANPSSIHEPGRKVRQAMDQARDEVATLLGATPAEIVFTSGGTEANHLAWNSFARPSARLATTTVEHASIRGAVDKAKRLGANVTLLQVDQKGLLQEESMTNLIEKGADFLSIQYANNETGVIFPIASLVNSLKDQVETIHVDGVQAVGKIDVNVADLGVDLFSISGHKVGALAGTGALFVRQGTPLEPLWTGQHHEMGRRNGTENIAGIVALGSACRLLTKKRTEDSRRLEKLRNHFESELLRAIPGCTVTAQSENRLPNTSHVSFDGADGQTVLIAVDLEGLSCSTGSACSSGSVQPSHVLVAMGLPPKKLYSSVRFSLGWNTTEDQIAETIGVLSKVIPRIRKRDT